ncbi:ABC transporter permease [Mammaliicoccus stepanovicii]|uniref:Osmotically activated L-carnitine/choline ABC transporter permease OpuCD n=1 Tax=Mammaliicoccus stepanovicii TaxID=643214 RepID=A0A239YXZ5_9STAP|nr:ABC transporter permease [Mammaliicoccus stepanovicii]PNZ75606.1 amino acid ABC transporter permease [Mammaliicoccus stepanovicii]GGI40515.1 amino acid ABC transporter permease [Mammaliicoccus stepanovicii]SNV63627.1 Osmotically activated L-carnitine/choline ABC transporter permease OpuCD [Mammaliicoccus stepanovicii]
MVNENLWSQIIDYYSTNGGYIFQLFLNHLLISVYGVLFAVIIGIPVGIFIARYSKLSGYVISIANIIQTIPALALLAILMLVMGLGANTVVMTVFLYALLPIIKNTYTGIQSVDTGIKDAGKGMGMTTKQILTMVELPLSLSVMIGGIRIAFVIAIGVTAIGSFIGSSTLGDIIIRGTNATDGTSLILAGAIPTALLAVLSDIVLGFIERKLDPTKKNQEGPKIQTLSE